YNHRPMADYRRSFQAGGTFFFTLVTEGRLPLFDDPARRAMLGDCFRAEQQRRPFVALASVLLPDHLHVIWLLPPGDANFSTRWGAIKADFARRHLDAGGEESPTSAARSRQ